MRKEYMDLEIDLGKMMVSNENWFPTDVVAKR